MLAKGAWFWYPSSNDAALAAIAVSLIVGAAGRTLGLDAMLASLTLLVTDMNRSGFGAS
jgi:hypothetical protein